MHTTLITFHTRRHHTIMERNGESGDGVKASVALLTEQQSEPKQLENGSSSADSEGGDVAIVGVESNGSSDASASLSQVFAPLGPTDRCTPTQAQSMGQQVLAIIALQERNKLPLPVELQNSFDIFHRCLAVVYGTFFLNLYTKANAPCLICHGCKCLYPPGQFIHHSCPVLPPNIVPCRSRMWRRCLVPLVSQGVDKLQQKQRWKYVLEKFSHMGTGVGRRNPIPPEMEAQILEIPECKRGRFVKVPSTESLSENTPSPVSSPPPSISSANHSNYIPTLEANYSQGLLDIEELETDDPPLSAGIENHQQRNPLMLAHQLVQEVQQLQSELAQVKAKLHLAEEHLQNMPSEACMREQLSQALSKQKALVVERDQALEQGRLAQVRAEKLQQQLQKLQTAHVEMEKHFLNGGQ